MSELIVCALTGDLMDRSRLSSAIPGVVFSISSDADVVIVDLARGGEQIAKARSDAPNARIVCYGPHVDHTSMDAARAAGADVVLPRSRFFRDPAAAIS